MTAPTPDRATGLGHVPGLDGLRGLAVAAVVAYHLGWLSGGFLGVDVFFVLSGFLVTSLVLAEVGRTGRLGLRAFWARRLRRLLPAVVVLVPVVLVAAWLVDWPATQRSALSIDGLATLTWWANWRQAGGASYWAPGPSPFRHAWSLSIEEQFYLAWPLVVAATGAVAHRLGRSVRLAVGLVAAAGVAASTVAMTLLARGTEGDGLSRLYLGTDTRAAAPLLGCALAAWWAGRAGDEPSTGRSRVVAVVGGHLGLLALGILVVSAHVPDADLYRNGGFLLAAVASGVVVAALVVVARGPGGGADPRVGLLAVAAWRPVRHLGTRSYAIYLWSWPTQALLQFWRPTWSRPVVTLVVVVAAMVAAEVSFVLVEDPLRRRRSWAARPVLRRPAWGVGLVAALVAVALVHRASVAPPAFERIETGESVDRASQAPPPPLTTTTDASGTTDPDAGPAPLRVVVEGDSVAFTAAYHSPRPDEMPAGVGTIDGRGVIGCGLLASAGWEYPASGGGGFAVPAAGECRGQADAEAIGLTGDPDVVLLVAGAWEYQPTRSPDGHEVEAQSDEMADVLVDAVLVRARAAHAVGAAFAIAEWACPGTKAVAGRRDPDYVRWVNGVFARAVAAAQDEGITAGVLPPPDTICVDGDATGEPTDAWRAATDDEIHVRNHEGGVYLWQHWLGPGLVALVHPGG